MKRYITPVLLFGALVSCTPQMEGVTLEPVVPAELIEVAVSPAQQQNVYTFSCDMQGASLSWDFGNGSKATGSTAQASYPFKGDYTITLTTLQEGGMVTKTIPLNVPEDNYELVKDPVFVMLSGGIEAADGKTWVMDSLTKGHLGLGPLSELTPSWWSAGVLEKTGLGMYDDELNFKLMGAQVVYTNNGSSYVNGGAKSAFEVRGGVCTPEPSGGDFIGAYEPSNNNWSWSLAEEDGTYYLSFPPSQAFAMYYLGEVERYQIVSINEDEMTLRTEVGDIAWYVTLIRKGFERPLPPAPEPEAIPLSEDFQGEEPTVPFVAELMGDLTNFNYSNPAPVGGNTSSSVMLYQKSTEFYSNTLFTAPYKFDLSTQNKVTIKVFVPSYNDFTTANEVAGEWIAENKLTPQLAIKLQDSSLGGDAWTTQMEIAHKDIALDQWVELSFDFSGAAQRVDFDRIVIQCGGEGHSGEGIFFIDDFKFSE